MTTLIHLTQSERDTIMKTLHARQIEFLTRFLRRGKRTTFANILAKEKAVDVEKNNFAHQWELLDYMDAGPSWRESSDLVCECGRLLRYQYVVNNLQTGVIKKFGLTHFEEHTGIPPYVAKQILRGFEEIDYELDEMLVKVKDDWTIEENLAFDLPTDYPLPSDIQAHMDYDVPLLRRQMDRLNEGLRVYKQTIQEEEEKKERDASLRIHHKLLYTVKHSDWWNQLKSTSPLDENLKIATIVYCMQKTDNQVLASHVCECLVTEHHASEKKYSSGTYEIFPLVCMFLEELAGLGRIRFMQKVNGLDRLYEFVDPYVRNEGSFFT